MAGLAGQLPIAYACVVPEIVQYTSDRLDAKYLGSKLTNDLGRITDGLVLHSEYDSHNKMNCWFVKRTEPCA